MSARAQRTSAPSKPTSATSKPIRISAAITSRIGKAAFGSTRPKQARSPTLRSARAHVTFKIDFVAAGLAVGLAAGGHDHHAARPLLLVAQRRRLRTRIAFRIDQ